MKKLIISESQYKRVFLMEQAPFNMSDTPTNELGVWEKYFATDPEMEGTLISTLANPNYTQEDKINITKKAIKDEAKRMWKIIKDNPLYQIFDCAGANWEPENYWHCVADNLSIAVSAVPTYGTAISSLIDLVNGLAWMVHGVWNCASDECDVWDFIAGIFTLAGVIPGWTEYTALKKINPRTMKASKGFLNELAHRFNNPKKLKNIKPKQLDKILNKHIKGLSPEEIKTVKLYYKAMTEANKHLPKMKSLNKEINNLMALGKWDQKELVKIVSSGKFKRLLKANGGDIIKALRISAMETAASTIRLQVGLYVGLGFGIVPVMEAGSSLWEWLKDNDKKKEKYENLEEEMIMIHENQKELYALYGFFRVFEECGTPPDPITDEYIKKITTCKARLTAIDAYNKGLELELGTKIDHFCPCEYVTDAGQWDIVLKSIKKYKGVKVWEKIKEIKEACLVDTESVCPGGQHKTLTEPSGKPITVKWSNLPSEEGDGVGQQMKDIPHNKGKRDYEDQPQNWEQLKSGYENY